MTIKYFCPTCKNQVEKLQACGAAQYFCDHCKGLVSKSKVIIEENNSEKTGKDSIE